MSTLGKIFGWIPGADLRNRHDGLALIAKKELKIDVEALKPGEMIMFVNTSMNQLVLYCANNILIHYKRPGGALLNPRTYAIIPQFIRDQQVDYDGALRKVIEAQLKEQHPRHYAQWKQTEK